MAARAGVPVMAPPLELMPRLFGPDVRALSGKAPTLLSVPESKAGSADSGRWMLRTMRGVMSSTISVFVEVSFCVPKMRLSRGSSPMPGMWLVLLRSSSLISPASTCVSPFFSRSVVPALRVPT